MESKFSNVLTLLGNSKSTNFTLLHLNESRMQVIMPVVTTKSVIK